MHPGRPRRYNYNLQLRLGEQCDRPKRRSDNWQYDNFGRKTQETRPDGTFTQWTYNDCSASGACLIGTHTANVQFTVFNADSSILTDGTTLYDPLERPYLANKRMLAGGTYARNEVRFDNFGRQIQQAAPCTWTALATPCPYWTTTNYDVLNRVTQVQRPVSSANSSLQTTGYQYAGDTTTITDPQGNLKTLIKDPNGWLRETKDAYGYAATLGYDAAGGKTSVSDSLGNTLWSGSYAYGIRPFLLGFTDTDRGSWGFTIDALGEKTAWTDAKGQQFSETYDALSRPLTRTEPDYFTQWTWGSSASSHNIGTPAERVYGLHREPARPRAIPRARRMTATGGCINAPSRSLASVRSPTPGNTTRPLACWIP